jgi:hypothetical protein
MQWGMFGMTAVFREVLFRLMGGSNFEHKRICAAVTVMRAQAALALLNMKHRVSLSILDPSET